MFGREQVRPASSLIFGIALTIPVIEIRKVIKIFLSVKMKQEKVKLSSDENVLFMHEILRNLQNV